MRLRLRDKAALKSEVATTFVKAIIVGIAFFKAGDNSAFQQMPFLFMCLQMSIMSGMQAMPKLIEDRCIMKIEVSDRLYNEWAFILSSFIITNAISQTLNVIFLLIAFGMSGISFSYFPSFYGWQLLVILTTDSMFNCIAAFAKSAEVAQQKAIPPLMFCIIFNGFFVTLKGVQVWMKWAIYVSPVFYGLQQIAISLFSDGVRPGDLSGVPYGDSGQFVIDQYGFQSDWSGIALSVLLSYIAVFRLLQVYALQKLNNPEK